MSFRMGLTVTGTVFYILEVDVNIDVPFKVFFDDNCYYQQIQNSLYKLTDL